MYCDSILNELFLQLWGDYRGSRRWAHRRTELCFDRRSHGQRACASQKVRVSPPSASSLCLTAHQTSRALTLIVKHSHRAVCLALASFLPPCLFLHLFTIFMWVVFIFFFFKHIVNYCFRLESGWKGVRVRGMDSVRMKEARQDER